MHLGLGHAGGFGVLQGPHIHSRSLPLASPPKTSGGRKGGWGRRPKALFPAGNVECAPLFPYSTSCAPPLPTPPHPTPALSPAQMNLSRPGLPQLISTASLHSLPTTSPFPLPTTKTASLDTRLHSFKAHTQLFRCQLCSSAPLGHLMSLSCFPGPSPEQGSRLESPGSFRTLHGHEGSLL